jgi:hypothetical protein
MAHSKKVVIRHVATVTVHVATCLDSHRDGARNSYGQWLMAEKKKFGRDQVS